MVVVYFPSTVAVVVVVVVAVVAVAAAYHTNRDSVLHTWPSEQVAVVVGRIYKLCFAQSQHSGAYESALPAVVQPWLKSSRRPGYRPVVPDLFAPLVPPLLVPPLFRDIQSVCCSHHHSRRRSSYYFVPCYLLHHFGCCD